MSEHTVVTPTSANQWSSWKCEGCGQTCSSDNPCDCCEEGP